ncbi:hypothetical protein [Agromyces sp. S2-1-8]|uniref:hypothetical protein n=1 Tax=Agromyces sp. S2-1-8 TaxID=2897180 RepID=UPI001E2D4A16|nr:hypothetical protein [Agromyces sp. S2-1-8]MCD5348409.1 hypothetical protein [Agromyces sp. S2-1-8]
MVPLAFRRSGTTVLYIGVVEDIGVVEAFAAFNARPTVRGVGSSEEVLWDRFAHSQRRLLHRKMYLTCWTGHGLLAEGCGEGVRPCWDRVVLEINNQFQGVGENDEFLVDLNVDDPGGKRPWSLWRSDATLTGRVANGMLAWVISGVLVAAAIGLAGVLLLTLAVPALAAGAGIVVQLAP